MRLLPRGQSVGFSRVERVETCRGERRLGLVAAGAEVGFPAKVAAEGGVGADAGAGDVAHGVVPTVLLICEGKPVGFEFVVGAVEPSAGAVSIGEADIVNEGDWAEVGGEVVYGFAENGVEGLGTDAVVGDADVFKGEKENEGKPREVVSAAVGEERGDFLFF